MPEANSVPKPDITAHSGAGSRTGTDTNDRSTDDRSTDDLTDADDRRDDAAVDAAPEDTSADGNGTPDDTGTPDDNGVPEDTSAPDDTCADAVTGTEPDAGAGTDDGPADRPGLTPRQARRVRIVVSAVVMTAVAVALVIRLGTAPSVLTVGFYGMALVLSGTAIVLSRRGRTRVATGVLVLGFGAVVLAERMLSAV